MSTKVKQPHLPTSVSQLRHCLKCTFSSRHRVIFDRHIKRCRADKNAKPKADVVARVRNYRCKNCKLSTTSSKVYLTHLRDTHNENIIIYACDHCEYASRYKCKMLRHRMFVHPNARKYEETENSKDDSGEDDGEVAMVIDEGEDDDGGDRENSSTPKEADHEMKEDSAVGENNNIVSNKHVVLDNEVQLKINDNNNDKDAVSELEQNYDAETENEAESNENVEGINGSGDRTDGAEDEDGNPTVTVTGNAIDYVKTVTDSSDQVTFQCELCTYTNFQKWKVTNHVRSFHMKKKIFRCSLCDFTTGRKIEFCIHKTKHSDKKVFSCDECFYRTVSRANYDRHVANHTLDGPVKCNLCTYSSTGEAAIQRHMQEYHPSYQMPVEPEETEVDPATELEENAASPAAGVAVKMEYNDTEALGIASTCGVCGQEFRTEAKLRLHMVTHSSESVHRCPLCILKYKRTSDLNRHMKRKHGLRLRDYFSSEQDQPLDLCVKKTGGSSESESSEQPLDLSFKSSPEKSPPIKEGEILRCSQCQYIAKWPSDLHRHLLVHSVEKQYQCDLCHRKYKYKFDLNMHLRKMHNVAAGRARVPVMPADPASNSRTMPVVGSNPMIDTSMDTGSTQDDDDDEFSVSGVFSSSPSPASLASLQDADGDVKPGSIQPLRRSAVEKLRKSPRQMQLLPSGKFKCEYCPYLGACRSEVDRHMRLHTGEKPYSCLFCTYKSHWKGDMKRHLQKHHPAELTTDEQMHQLMLRSYRPELAFDHIQGDQKPEITSFRPTPTSSPEPYMAAPNVVVNSDGELEPSGSRSPAMQTNDLPQDTICPLCQFVSESPSKLKIHMEMHGDMKRFKCKHCGLRSNWVWDIRKHIRKEHPSEELSVVVLSEEEAQETLDDYLQNHHKLLVQKSFEGYEDSFSDEEPTHTLPMSGGEQFREAGITPLEEMNAALASKMEYIPKIQQVSRVGKPSSRAANRFRPYMCSKCGRRSNWKWDLRKHIRASHPNARMITLTEEEARVSWPPKKPTPTSPTMVQPQTSMPSSIIPMETFALPTTHMAPTLAFNSDLVSSPSEGSLSPATPTKYFQQVDPKRLKRFKCSLCPYRSNYRSDIGRHIKRLHHRAMYRIIVLDEEEAKETLTEYKDTYGHKKFVLSPAKKRSQPKPESQGFFEQEDEREGAVLVDEEPEETTVTMEMDGTDEMKVTSKAWKCPRCPFQNKSKQFVMTHIRKHPKLKVFKCRLCDEATDYRNSIYRHIRIKHDTTNYMENMEESVVCVDTGSECDGDASKENKVFACQLCGQTSHIRGSLLKHIGDKHQDCLDPSSVIIEKPLPFLPTKSPSMISSPDVSTMFAHSQNITGAMLNMNRLRCDVCPYRTSKMGLLKMHRTYHVQQGANRFKCPYCPYFVSAPRLLHQHVRLHVQEPVTQPPENEANTDDAYAEFKSDDAKMLIQLHAGQRNFECDQCPFKCRNKNDYIYHKQFHRVKPGAIFKCNECNYWVSQRRLLTQHSRVHAPDYTSSMNKLGTAKNKPNMNDSMSSNESSPVKSESDLGCDAVEMAQLKHKIISSKITCTPVTPEKFSANDLAANYSDDESGLVMDGIMVDESCQLLSAGTLRTLNKCHYCPYAHLRSDNLRMHEQMHDNEAAEHGCPHCSYRTRKRSLYKEHIRVHALQYEPGKEEIKDAELPGMTFTDGEDKEDDDNVKDKEGKDDEDKDDETSPTPSTPPASQTPPKQSTPMPTLPPASCTGPHLHSEDLPDSKNQFYVKYNEKGEHMMERATFKKWCCEKCPYATMKRSQFERHIMLHGSRQRCVCEFCDYSVPIYQLLLQHKQLHLQPNPNLLTTQSIANLVQLPTLPADAAAASNFPMNTTDPSSHNGVHDHLKLYENTDEFMEPRKMYQCDRCPYTNVRRDNLLAHLKFHMVKSELPCPYCDYSVSKQHLLVQHVKVHFSSAHTDLKPGPDNSRENASTELAQVQRKEMTDNQKARWKETNPDISSLPENQPEYIDISELESAIITTNHEPNNNENEKPMDLSPPLKKAPVQIDTIAPVEVTVTDKHEMNGVGNLEEKTSSDTMWICQYCDRAFDASEKLMRHESQHLVGNKF